MAPKQITEADLLRLEGKLTLWQEKMKADITSEQADRRHWQNNAIQNIALTTDELNTEQKLIKQTVWTMAKQLENIEGSIKELGNKIDTWFNKVHENFVTKVEHLEKHDENKKRIERMEWAILLLLVSLAGYLMTLAASKIFH